MKKIVNVLRTTLPKVCSKKIFRIMKLANLLFLVTVFNLFGAKTYSQYTRLNLDMKDVPIQTVLNAIEGQSEFFFLYSSKMIDVTQKVDIVAESKKINEVLDELLAKTDIKYTVRDRQIMLVNKKAELPVNIQQQPVIGTIKDSQTGAAMPGVNIQIKGTTLGTISDATGKFSLNVSDPNAVLIFSFIGYSTIEVPVAGKTIIDLDLESEVAGLDEVVVIGYGTMKKRDLTGSVSSVKTGQTENEKPQAIQDILRGNVAGLEVGLSTSAKGGGSLEIRGDKSLKTSSTPLLVLDGVIYPGALEDINPVDIETIDVLKDASSSAVFGAHAANGVIVITTKKGKSGKPLINLTSSVGVATLATMPDIYGPDGFITWRQDVLRALNYYNPNTKNKLYIFDNPEKLPDGVTMTMWMDNKTGDPLDIWLARLGLLDMEVTNYKEGKSVDWKKMVFQNGVRQDHNLSISGTKDEISYYWSLGYNNNEGIIVGDQFKTIRSRVKIDAKVTRWMTAGLNTQFSNRDESSIEADWTRAQMNPPYGSIYEDDGVTLRLSPTDNPGSGVRHPLYDKIFQDRRQITKSTISTLYANIKLPLGITYQMNFTPEISTYDYMNHQSAKHQEWAMIGGRSQRQQTSVYSWQIDNLFKWNKVINVVHKIDATFLINAEKYQSWSNWMAIQGFDPTDALGYHYMQAGTSATSSITSNDQYSTGDALMGRLFYSFKDRYMATVSVRRDGYSAFGLENPRGTFPALALGWTFTEEEFLKNNILTYGKLRVSWGANGNREIGRYAALSNMGIGKYAYNTLAGTVYQMNSLYPSNMSNYKLKWERTQTINIGVDFSILAGLLDGSMEFYKERTLDLLIDRSIPSILGYSPSTVASNLGEVDNRGFELNLNARILDRPNFAWRGNLTFSLNRNEIVHLYGDMVDVVDASGNVIGQKEGDDIQNKWFIGHSIDEIWEPRILGVWQIGEETEAARYGQNPGDFKLLDKDNNGKINDIDNEFQGFRRPRFQWNMRHEFKIYKNFDLSLSLYSYWGHKGTFNSAKNRDGNYPDRLNSYIVPYWTPQNPLNDYARIFSSEGGAVFNVWREKSFIRLDNISLSYTLPNNVINSAISNLKFLVTIRNIGYYAPKWKFWDPENSAPTPRYFTFGVNLTL
jgi:TonB-dependent starch-binding outer membrane protein SusC